MSEKWPFLETTEFNPFLETSRELVSSRAVSKCVQFVIVLSKDRNLGRADELTGQI